MRRLTVSIGFLMALGSSRSEAVPIGPGDSFRFVFDFDDTSPTPPYLAIDYQIVFGSADLLEQGEGWSVQVLSASGVVLSPVVVFRSPFTDPTTGILTTLKQILYEPLPEAVGYLQFGDIEGTFDLSCRAFVRAWTTLDIKQAEVGVTLTPLVPARVLAAASPGVLFVDDDAPSGGDGTSWATAFTHVQDALRAATTGDDIRVAQGSYRPDQDESGIVAPGDRTATFQLRCGVALMGGYAGVGAPDPDLRDIVLYKTILSGDLAADDSLVPCTADSPECDAFGGLCGSDGFCIISANNGENSFHVLVGSDTDPTTVLDGFTITAGNGKGECCPNTSGAGMYNSGGSPTVINCTFRRNMTVGNGAGGAGMHNEHESNPTVADCNFVFNSAHAGGGMHNDNSSPTVINCAFRENFTALQGAGMRNQLGGSATVTDCVFSGNVAAGAGGGMTNQLGSSPTIAGCLFIGNTATSGGGISNFSDGAPAVLNCTFAMNTASELGGGMFTAGTGAPIVANSVFWHNEDSTGTGKSGQIRDDSGGVTTVNYSNIQGGWTGAGGAGNINADPAFVDANGPDGISGTEDDDLHPLPGSPLIDAGDNDAVSPGITNDLDGNPRFIDDPATQDTGNPGALGPPVVDMGAYELQLIPCQADADCDDNVGCTIDTCDAATNSCIRAASNGLCQDGVFCNGQERCHPLNDCQPAGDPCSAGSVCNEDKAACSCLVDSYCDDGLFCDGTEVCNTLGACEPGESPCLVAFCDEDHDFCLQCLSDSDCGDPGTCVHGICRSMVPIIWHVDANVTPGGDGTTWATALAELRSAVFVAVEGDEIWVAQGVYVPGPTGLADPRTATFQLVSGVRLYGGFPSGGGNGSFDARNPVVHATILSGDLAGDDVPVACTQDSPDCDLSGTICFGGPCIIAGSLCVNGACIINANTTENSYHVVTGGGTANTAVLDGFTITAGRADSTEYPNASLGAGMYNRDGAPTVNGCTFSGNVAYAGGGMINLGGSPTVDNCVFSGNAAYHGGAMGNLESTAIVSNSRFEHNTANFGGAMINVMGETTVRNSTFTGNTAWGASDFSGHGGAMFNWGNYGGFGVGPRCGNGVLDSDEECDGSQDAACPGLCRPDCRCYRPAIATVTNCTFAANSASSGGGGGAIFNLIAIATEARVTGSDFVGNVAGFGGGMANFVGGGPTPAPTLAASTAVAVAGWMPTLSKVIPDAKHSPQGGTIASRAPKTVSGGAFDPHVVMAVTDCTFNGNTSLGAAGFPIGGGAIYNQSPNATVTRCSFTSNIALGTPDFPNLGGAIVNESELTATDCVFGGNIAGIGGGIANLDFSSDDPDAVLAFSNCTFSANTAIGAAAYPGLFGGALLNAGGIATADNSVLWGDGPDEILSLDPSIESLTVSFSDVQGGLPPGTIDGGGNIDADPLFVDADLRLGPGSPCIDAGDNAEVTVPTDLDGNRRRVDDLATKDTGAGTAPIVDVGAYEFGSVPCGPADLDCDGDVDLRDWAKFQACFGAIDPLGCNPSAMPDLDGDGQVNLADHVLFSANLAGPGL